MKSMKILGALAAASLLFSVSGFAQENANRDANGNVVRGPYETNAFGDNWFVGGGIGLNSGINTGNHGTIDWIIAPGLALDVNVGKWLTPEYGLRVNYHGLTNQSTFKPFNLFNKWEHAATLDVLFDLSSLIDGYQETRDWSFIVYPSAGWGWYTGGNNMWLLGVGGIAKKYAFLGNENLDMIIDLRAFAAPNAEISWKDAGYTPKNKLDGAFYKLGAFSFPLSATWGVAYKFGKQGFKRSASIVPAVVPVPFTTQQYEDLSSKVAELEKENADLKKKIADLENENEDLRKKLASGQNYVYEQGQFVAVDTPQGAPLTIYFDCGSATVSAREKAHFEYFAENCVKEDTKLNVNGYADKQTGTAKRNQQLSEQRAKAVVELLKKAGAKEENITCAAHGASVQPFEGAAKNRVVTIEIVK